MQTLPTNRRILSALALGTAAWLGGCESSDDDPMATGGMVGTSGGGENSNTRGTGGIDATGGRTDTGGAANTGGAADTGGTVEAGGAAGAECPPSAADPIIWTEQGGAGGEGGASAATALLCNPGGICFTPAIPVSGLSFVRHVFATLNASAEGPPVATHPTAKVTTPEVGKVCIKGDDGAGFNLGVYDGPVWGGMDVPPADSGGTELRAGSLGITAVTFTVETSLEADIVVRVISFPPPCEEVVVSSARQNGNDLVITESGTKTTLSFATDFWPTFDTNAIGALNFWAGDGPYDYCISDVKFLDGDGNEVVP